MSITKRSGCARKKVLTCVWESSPTVTRAFRFEASTSTLRTVTGSSAQARPLRATLESAVKPARAKERRVTSMKIGKVPEAAYYQVEKEG